jgi:hypothetical protein
MVFTNLGHFQGRQFATARFIFMRPVLSYSAVATAIWQLILERADD